MAKATLEVIGILRNTVSRLSEGADYQWGHMGCCNCGFLAREVADLKKEDIHAAAMQRPGDWSEQLNDYCASSGFPFDNLITHLLSTGFSRADLIHLERLSDPQILRTLPPENRYLKYNSKDDVIRYLTAWTLLLETKLLEHIEIMLPPVGVTMEA